MLLFSSFCDEFGKQILTLSHEDTSKKLDEVGLKLRDDIPSSGGEPSRNSFVACVVSPSLILENGAQEGPRCIRSNDTFGSRSEKVGVVSETNVNKLYYWALIKNEKNVLNNRIIYSGTPDRRSITTETAASQNLYWVRFLLSFTDFLGSNSWSKMPLFFATCGPNKVMAISGRSSPVLTLAKHR